VAENEMNNEEEQEALSKKNKPTNINSTPQNNPTTAH